MKSFGRKYEEDNKAKNMLGTIIVFLLVEKEYILQLDYKEDLVDYIEDIDNYWGKEEVKLISFEVDNDQQYYAYVPKKIDRSGEDRGSLLKWG